MYKEFRFQYARDSLGYLIKFFNIKEIYLPYYLCDVIRHRVFQENCKPLFYHIDNNFYPAQEFPKKSFILYPNYFGICNTNVNKLEKIYRHLIVDNAHAFYLEPQGLACFNSERKFRDVENGSSLWIKEDEKKGDLADSQPNRRIKITSYEGIERFIYLHNKYKEKNQLKINLNSVTSPFCYPYLASTDDEADELAEQFTQEGYIIYRYWNNLPKKFNEYKFYRRLVPIPIVAHGE